MTSVLTRIDSAKSTAGDIPGLHIELERVLEVLTNPSNEDLVERHLNALQRLCWSNRDGFSIRDLGKVLNVVEITLGLAERHEDIRFEEGLGQLLQVLSKPFIRKSATDEVKGFSQITALLERVGEIMHHEGLSDELRAEAALLVEVFCSGYQAHRPDQQPQTERPASPRQFLQNQQLVLRSDIPGHVVRALASAEGVVQQTLVRVCLQMSHTPDLAERLVECGVFEHLPTILSRGSLHDTATVACTEVCWNLLDAAPEAKLSEAAATCLARSLRVLFEEARVGAFRNQDKEQRNDLMVLVLLLSRKLVHQEAFLKEGVTHYLIECAQYPEVPTVVGVDGAEEDMTLTRPFGRGAESSSPPDDFDLQLRQLAWCALSKLCQHEETLRQALEGNFLWCLMKHSDPMGDPIIHDFWSHSQRRALAQLAPSMLLALVPLCMDQFAAEGGAELVVRILTNCREREALRMVLGLVHACAEQHEGLRALLGEAGALPAIVSLMENAELATDALKNVAMLAVTALTGEHKANQDLFRKADGVPMLLQELSRLCQADHSLPSPYAVVVVEAVWASTARCRKSLARFLLFDGMESLLNLLEVCHSTVQPMILSCLSDVLQNPKSQPYLLAWESTRTKRSAIGMLLDLWRAKEMERPLVPRIGQDEAAEGSSRDKESADASSSSKGPHGILGRRTSHHQAPTSLAGNATYTLLDPKRVTMVGTFKLLTSAESTLAKIYAVLKNLGSEALDGLSSQDKATFCIVQNYIRLLQGEIWQRVAETFAKEGFRPTRVDQQRLDGALTQYRRVASLVRSQQEAVEEEEEKNMVIEEAQFYADLLSQRDAEQSLNNFKKGDNGRTLKDRLDAKKKKESMLKASARPNADLSTTLSFGVPPASGSLSLGKSASTSVGLGGGGLHSASLSIGGAVNNPILSSR